MVTLNVNFTNTFEKNSKTNLIINNKTVYKHKLPK